jgi:hypothetical protein
LWGSRCLTDTSAGAFVSISCKLEQLINI